MKKILQFILKISAKLILRKYQPQIIGITGSVGKTSAKEAVWTVLSQNYRVRRNQKNYNNEIGLPLTIIGCYSPGNSYFGWLKVFFKTLGLLLFQSRAYPEILVLEMGVDRPGDMDYLNTIVSPKIAVLTTVGASHLEQFGSLEALLKEKRKIFDNLQPGGWAVLNYDDPLTKEVLPEIKNKVLTFGFAPEADVSAQHLQLSCQEARSAQQICGINFKLKYQESYIPILLPQVFAQTAVSAALIGAAAGLLLELNGVEIANALKHLRLPKGRLNLIPGKNNSLIIDDSYNASPQSCLAAIAAMRAINLPDLRQQWLCLGDMLELGPQSEDGHLQVGKAVAVELPLAKLLTCGPKAKLIAEGARRAGLPEERIKTFTEQRNLIFYLQNELQPNDLILVKGSQGARLEKVVEAIMAQPDQAADLLVRQDKEWRK